MCLLLQAHMLVCRALSNMLLLPWPNLPENEQQWQTRSSNHGSLLAALTREYRILRGTVSVTSRQPDLNNSQSPFSFFSFWFCGRLSYHLLIFLSSSESGDPADAACAQGHRGQHLRGIHQVASDLLPEPSGVGPSLTQPLPSVHPAAR